MFHYIANSNNNPTWILRLVWKIREVMNVIRFCLIYHQYTKFNFSVCILYLSWYLFKYIYIHNFYLNIHNHDWLKKMVNAKSKKPSEQVWILLSIWTWRRTWFRADKTQKPITTTNLLKKFGIFCQYGPKEHLGLRRTRLKNP